MSVGAIIALITAIAGAIPILYKMFKKPTESKVEQAQDRAREDIDEFKKTGRPKR